MRIHVAKDQMSATAFIRDPAATLQIERRAKGRDWSGIHRDGSGQVSFDGYLSGSEEAKTREVLGMLMETFGLR